MCGFFAAITKVPSFFSIEEKENILNSFEWRGPDDEGIWEENNILLLHKRLAILDLSNHGHQPMVCEEGRFVIAYNGEVYNWKEIRKSLNFDKWRSNTDTETVLYAYKEMGADCLNILNGMFAFAIWDQKERKLFFARDHVGVKPLYYSFTDQYIFVASEIKTLLSAGVKKKINFKAVSDYLNWGLLDHSQNTFFESIYSLDAGKFVTIDLNAFELNIHTYWSVYQSIFDKSKINKNEAIEEFQLLLNNSIKLQTQADVDVGVCLSGGVDSSVLAACTAKNSSATNLKTFTYFFEGGGGEEILAEDTSKILGLDNIQCELKHQNIPQYLKKVLHYQESPVTSMRVLALHRLFEECKKQNIKVMLEGAGGDEMGAGYEYYYLPYIMDLLKDKDTPTVLKELNIFMERFNIPQEKRMERLVDCLKTVLQPGVSTQDGVSFVYPNCLNNEYFSEFKAPKFEGYFSDWLRNLQLIDFSHVVLPKALRYTDRASMSSSCESRVPMLDHRIVELSFRAAPEARMQNGHQRIFMRTAAEKILPKSILHRPKQTIVDPQRTWLKRELKEWIYDVFNSQTARNLGFLNMPKIIQEYETYLNTDSPRTSAHIFQYLNIITWYQVFFDEGYTN